MYIYQGSNEFCIVLNENAAVMCFCKHNNPFRVGRGKKKYPQQSRQRLNAREVIKECFFFLFPK